jgi:transcriptional regulator with XRE-family HTH domain
MNEPLLETVLEEYLSATPNGNDLKILQEFSNEYPQFAQDLEDFAAARAVAKHAPEEELSAEEEEQIQESGLVNLRSVLSSLKAVGSSPRILQSLVETAKSKGMKRSQFATALGLSTSLVIYLEKRRLEFATIPTKIVAKIAEVLGIAEEAVADYLNQTPDLSVNASYKTETRAEELPPKSFTEAVREDQILTAEEKRKLLEL